MCAMTVALQASMALATQGGVGELGWLREALVMNDCIEALEGYMLQSFFPILVLQAFTIGNSYTILQNILPNDLPLLCHSVTR